MKPCWLQRFLDSLHALCELTHLLCDDWLYRLLTHQLAHTNLPDDWRRLGVYIMFWLHRVLA